MKGGISMNIKEAESLTGITKQNIRFYEKKGLLTPQRNENKYREYSNEDIERLLQIKMLRKLDVPIEHIQRIFDGEDQNEIIQRHLDNLVRQKNRLEDAITICSFIPKKSKEPMDTQAILSKMEELEQKGGHFMEIIHDYKKIANAEKREHFTFWPDILVKTPEDFTKALCQYGSDRNLNLVVTEPGLYPKFEIDGIEYEACRQIQGYGSVIICKATKPEQLKTLYSDVTQNRRTALFRIYRVVQCLTVPVFLLAAIIAANFWIAIIAFLLFLCLEISCRILFWKRNR